MSGYYRHSAPFLSNLNDHVLAHPEVYAFVRGREDYKTRVKYEATPKEKQPNQNFSVFP